MPPKNESLIKCVKSNKLYIYNVNEFDYLNIFNDESMLCIDDIFSIKIREIIKILTINDPVEYDQWLNLEKFIKKTNRTIGE